MTIIYQGVDCTRDKGTVAFERLHKLSQKQVPWKHQTHYGLVTVYFACATVGLVLLKNVWFKFRDFRIIHGERRASFMPSIVNIIAAYCRLFGYPRVPAALAQLSFPRSWGCTLYTFVATGYLLGYCLQPHFWYRACKGFGSPPLAVRAGIMSTALTPFLFALSGKTNIISALTGISYEKLSWVHQYTGVALMVLALIHTIPFIYQPLHQDGYAYLRTVWKGSALYDNGVPPMVLLILLCLLFRKEVRQWVYELSFHLHWMMACAYFGTLMRHVWHELKMERYMWATLAIWIAQYIYKLAIKTLLGSLRTHKATFEQVGQNAFSITIEDVNKFHWKPGQHCFLRFPKHSVFDNHPFSIASVIENEQLRFVVVPRSGLTKRLSSISEPARVLLDGPYGGMPRNPGSFDKICLFASGSGITAVLPYLSVTGIVQKIDLVWVVRSIKDIEYVSFEDRKNVSVDVYIAGEKSQCEVRGESESESYGKHSDGTQVTIEKAEEAPQSNVYMHHVRPDVHQLALTSGLLRRTLYVVSGSASMQRAVSSAAAERQKAVINGDILQGSVMEEIYLHSETFGW